MALLGADEAQRIVTGVGSVFGQSYTVRVYESGADYKAKSGNESPSYGWFNQKIMRVLLSTRGIPGLPNQDIEFPAEAIVSITAHEVGHLVIGPKSNLAGYASMRLLMKRKNVGQEALMGGAINNQVTDLAINRHMGADDNLARKFGAGAFERGRLIVFRAGGWAGVEPAVKAGSVTRFGSPPYDPGVAFEKFSALSMLRNQNPAAYQRERGKLTGGERAFDDLVNKMADTAMSLDTQQMYDLMVDAMYAFTRIVGARPDRPSQIDGLVALLQQALGGS